MRTYGTLRAGGQGRDRHWLVTAEPHVMIRFKRLFGRVATHRSGEVRVAHTPDVARDLEWFTARYPLDMDAITAELLRAGADAYRDRETAVIRALAGHRADLPGFRLPARPARSYQQAAVDIVHATGHLLVTDELGLGKSMIGVLVLGAPDALPGLVVTLTHLPSQWIDEIAETYPDLRAHIIRQGTPYDVAKACGGHEPDVLVMNYAKLAGWADHLAQVTRTVIFDEAQELRRGDSRKYVAAAQVADGARYKVGLTATPVYNYGGEIHNVIQVLAPDMLGTREEFIREWGRGYSGGDFTKVSVQNPRALGTFLRDQGLMLGRTRRDVGRELPEIVRVTHTINADRAALDAVAGDAAEMARLILAETSTRDEKWRAAGELDWKMRQATGVAKAPYVAEFVRLLLASDEPVVLFGWHRECYDLWADLLAEFNPMFYTGSESPAAKDRSARAFLDGDSRLLIMSLRAGAGLDGLQERAHVAVFGELDWSPQVHNQCLGRLHRDGQDETVIAYYLVADAGSDPMVAQVLNLKRAQSEPLVNPDVALFQPADHVDRVRLLAQHVLHSAAGIRQATSERGEDTPARSDSSEAARSNLLADR